MRKKLLRSRTGFEKPESREEAIMQNILGASNVLEPSESNIEEILKSILYNTPYTKEAEFEIEKILLAIKNNGTYDGEGESRDMKILIAILNDLDYTEEAESRIEELFIEWLHQRSSIKVLEGVPPLTFTSRGLPLINYLIEGNTIQNGTPTPNNPIMPQGTGERTGNLFDLSVAIQGKQYGNNGELIDSTDNWYATNYIPVTGGETYIRSIAGVGVGNIYNEYDNTKTFINRRSAGYGNPFTVGSNTAYITFSINTSTTAIEAYMLNTGSTPLPYEPYGYKIPILSASTTTPVYLGEVETTRQIKKLVLTGEENFDHYGSSVFLVKVEDNNAMINGYGVSNSYVFNTATSDIPTTIANNEFCLTSGNGRLWIKNTNYDSASSFINYLARQYANGTPVTIWYVLATEETGIVNEPLMRIGDYADTLSMEQAGVEIPTASGSNTLDVDTTVKPSNVYIEYK